MKYIKDLNWKEIQKYYDDNHTWREVSEKFEISEGNIGNAKKKGLFISRTISEGTKLSMKLNPRNHTDESKKKISESRKKYLIENPDKVPYLLNHSSKGESYPEKYFDIIFKDKFEYVKFLPINLYHIDFAITNKKIAIEVDGDQHYLDDKIVKSDIRKNKCLIDNGWDIIRIRWSNYQKMNRHEKETYIIELIRYIHNLINIKPEIKFEDKRNYCGCGKQIHKRSKNCIKCSGLKQKTSEIFEEKINYCECGKKIYKTSKMCIRCTALKQKRKVENRPTVDELKIMLKNSSLEAVGKKYGVTGNCIKKWLK